ncbi:MAG: DEAD/DEAH box helicase [Rhizobiaceae bacterium]|nr:DEAD/DEAH box helicase [Rhizobiaceae bacterium]
MTQFTDLGLSPKVLSAVADAGYSTPTPIQAAAIPSALERKDVLGIAQTGTGKTAAFVLPMITLLEKGRARARMPRTLILEPTRELAAQVEENFTKYGKNHKLNVALLIGGVSFDEQEKKLERGADVLIATPGRLLDHFERGKLLMTGVEILVIDEADRMLDMGFIPDIERIAKLTPMTRQTLFFSATMPPEITRLADQFLHAPVRVEVAKPAQTAKTITQKLVACGSKDWAKRAKLRELIDAEAATLKNAIIFCNRKVDVADLLRSLLKHEYSVGALHGDMDQRSRMATLEAFRANKLSLLVASDVAARGLDIPDVSHVFNFDVPIHAEDYVHRIGRTGRAGRSGAAYMLVTKRDSKYLDAILKLTGDAVEWHDGDMSTLVEEVGDDKPQRGSRDAKRGPRGGNKRDHAPKPDHEKQAFKGLKGDTVSQDAAAAPAGVADTPKPEKRREERPHNERQREIRPGDQRQRDDRKTEGRQRDARSEPQAAQASRDPQPREHERKPRHDRDNDNSPVPLGFGDDTPAFMRNGLK